MGFSVAFPSLCGIFRVLFAQSHEPMLNNSSIFGAVLRESIASNYTFWLCVNLIVSVCCTPIGSSEESQQVTGKFPLIVLYSGVKPLPSDLLGKSGRGAPSALQRPLGTVTSCWPSRVCLPALVGVACSGVSLVCFRRASSIRARIRGRRSHRRGQHSHRHTVS